MANLWDRLEDSYEALVDARRACRECGRITREHLEDGYCHRCNAAPLESDEVIMARKRRLRPEWFDAAGNYKPVGRL